MASHPEPADPGASQPPRREPESWWHRIRRWIIGPPRDFMSPEVRRHITLIAFFAWVGLGADGLSSSAYGPEEAFIALGPYTGLALYLALATAVTVFVIALSYNQVIELFPSGGGGYKVATRLVGRGAGLVSGSALVVDYVLTIAISIAAGVDAIFSFLPRGWEDARLETKVAALLVLTVLNLRGIKDSIKVLLPIFAGFVLTHVALIVYGIGRHLGDVAGVVSDSLSHVFTLTRQAGVFFVIALFLRAYTLGGGTYTGIEAVSNGINMLKEPRVHTGKWTMFYMAVSLAFTAGGIILLYLLWNAHPVAGLTLNAVVFGEILRHWQWGAWNIGATALVVSLAFEAGLLLVAANTGFVGGPAVLANMAVDHWVPHRFAQLSDRLVTKNGILLMGGAAFAVLLWSAGRVDLLVVLYSINVFLTFTLTLLGMCIYWWRNRASEPTWRRRLALSVWGLGITASILAATLAEKFYEGGWITVLITSALIGACWLIHDHYRKVRGQLAELDEILSALPVPAQTASPPPLQEREPTAVFFVSSYHGVGIHTLLNVQRLFPGRFKNFVFMSVGEVDTTRIKGDGAISGLKDRCEAQLVKYVEFCNAHGLAATCYADYGTDPVEVAVRLAENVRQRFPGAVFFAGTLVFKRENWMTRVLHNYTALAIQRQLHLLGLPLVIMPLLVDSRG